MERASKSKKTGKTVAQPVPTVLVGTYRKDQLKKWILPKGLYNYPVHDEDAAIKAAAPDASELWLYAGKKDRLRFSASFVREVSTDELAALGITRAKGAHSPERHLLFESLESRPVEQSEQIVWLSTP